MTVDELLRIRNHEKRITASHPFHMVLCPHCRADVTQSEVIVCSRHCEQCGSRVVDPDPEGDEPTPEEELALPTVAEYINETRPYRLFTRWGVRGLVCVLVVGFMMTPVLLSSIPGGAPEWLYTLMLGWVCVGIPLLVVICFAVLTIRSAWNPKLTCPHCKEPNVDAAERIISSRCCPSCGVRQLLDNPTTEVKSHKQYSLSRVIEHRKSRDRIRQIKNYILTFIFMAFLLLPVFVAFFTRINPAIAILLTLTLCIIASTTYSVYIHFIHVLRCSCCRGRLRDYAIIVATKNCYHCGERVIAKPTFLPPEIRHDAG